MNEWIKITDEDKHYNKIFIPWTKKNRTCFIWFNGRRHDGFKITTCKSWNYYFEDSGTCEVYIRIYSEGKWNYLSRYEEDDSLDSYYTKMEMHKSIGKLCFISDEWDKDPEGGPDFRTIHIIPISYVDAYCLYPDDYKEN